MTNGQLPTLALEGNRAAVGFFVPLQRMPRVGMQTVATAECLLPMLGYLTHRVGSSPHHQHLLHIGPNVCFQHSTHCVAALYAICDMQLAILLFIHHRYPYTNKIRVILFIVGLLFFYGKSAFFL